MKTRSAALGSTARQGSPLGVRLAIFGLLAALVSGVILSQIDDLEVSEVAPHFLFVIALQLVPFVARARPDPFEPASLGSYFTLFALVPAFLSFALQGGLSISLLPFLAGRTRIELVQTVLLAYGAGTIAYYAGYYAPWGRRLTGMFPDIAGYEWRRSRVLMVTALCAGLFIPAYAYFQARVGVAITDVTQLAAGKAVWREDTTMSWLMRAIGLGFVPLLLYTAITFQVLRAPRWAGGTPFFAHAAHALRHFPVFFRTPRGRRALLTVVTLFVVSLLAVRLGQRGVALYAALSSLIIIHYLWRRIPITLILALTFVALVVTNVLGEYRQNRDQATATMPGPTANFDAAETLVEHDDDRRRFAGMAVVMHFFPDRQDYLMGKSWAVIPAMLVPRWVWPDKVNLFRWRDSNLVVELVGAPVPATYLALLFANFSWFGVALGMAGFGLFQRGMYEWLLRNQRDRSVVVFYSLAVLYLVPTIIQLSAAIGYLLPVYAALVFIKKRAAARSAKAALPAPREPGPTAARRALAKAGERAPELPEPGPAAAE